MLMEEFTDGSTKDMLIFLCAWKCLFLNSNLSICCSSDGWKCFSVCCLSFLIEVFSFLKQFLISWTQLYSVLGSKQWPANLEVVA